MSKQVYLGLVLGLVVLLIDQVLTLNNISVSSYFFWGISLPLAVVAIFMGLKLSLWVRVWAGSVIFIDGIYSALYGRSFGVHLTMEHLLLSVGLFFLLSIWYFIPLWRICENKLKLKMMIIYPVVSISLALLIATAEEYVFVVIHNEGVGPTKRWTINTSWMAYEAGLNGTGGVLRGGD